jgi:hypothetical protein
LVQGQAETEALDCALVRRKCGGSDCVESDVALMYHVWKTIRLWAGVIGVNRDAVA